MFKYMAHNRGSEPMLFIHLSSGAYHETKHIMVISNEPGIVTFGVILEMRDWTLTMGALYLISRFISSRK
jgi:hypothetical protein